MKSTEKHSETQRYKEAILSTANTLQLSKASVTSYLPYQKGVYYPSTADKEKISVGAERQRRYRAVRKLRTEPTEEHLWEVVLLYADVRFKTYSGLPFTYEIRKGRNTAFVSKMAFDAENSLIMLPVETGMGASPTTGYVDLWAYPKSSQKSDLVLTYRKNMEYGSARWGTHEDIAPYVDPVFRNNVILTQTESLTMNSRPKDPRTARNKNVLIIGGSGSGKTRFWLKPNLMQMHASYVVTDPKGTILVECGKMLQRGAPKLGKDGKPVRDKHGKVVYEPYRIKVLNTINFKKSMHYNPFSYIHSEKDILKLVTTLIANTKGEGKGGDDFWLKAETLLYTALIGYIHYEAPVEEQNFSTLIEFINAMEVREDDEEFKNPVDLMFDALEAEKPDHFAVRQYKKYKLAAGDICSK